MNKKILSLVLALVMVLGTFTSVFAETKTEAKKEEAKVEKIEKVVGKQNKIDYIRDKKIVEGDEKGNLNLDSNVKRSEITKVLVIANGEEEAAKNLQGVGGVYKDLKADHWANGYIVAGTTRSSKVNDVKMLNGYPDDTFKPENDVTYAELAKMLVVLAKKDLTVEMANNAVWYRDWINWANDLGIFADVTVTDYNKPANRADTFTMLYNALYTMKEFKRVPSNEVRGIISGLDGNKLTLNQDSTKEYKVIADTVFVRGTDGKNQNIVRLKDINIKATDYYLGSLVRVLVNDKNEATHIIELGNPEFLARNNAYNYIKDNNRVWAGVSDHTVETTLESYVETLKDRDTRAKQQYTSYVTVGLNSDKTKAKTVTFHGIKNADANDQITLRINDKTEVYVANPYNNQMRKVNGIVEALSLIGYRDYDGGYRIPNVYAGFDTDGARDAHKEFKFNVADRHTAKVVVFNVVSKDKGGELFRVLNSPSSGFSDTLERADGSLLDRNNYRDISIFPLNYSEHLDVIEVYNFANGSNHEVKIDRSNTTKFPIVEVIKNDGKFLEVKDGSKIGNIAVLDIRDADIFSAKRFDNGKLEAGSKIQFRVEKHDAKNVEDRTSVAEIISILPRDTELKGSLYNVIPSVDAREERGTIIDVKDINGEFPVLHARVYNNVLNAADSSGNAYYNISKDDAAKLVAFHEAHPTLKIVFTVRDNYGWGSKFYAANFRYETADGKVLPLPVPTAKKSAVETIKAELNGAVQKYGNDFEGLKSCDQLEKAQARLDRIDAAIAKLNLEEKAQWSTAEKAELKVYFDAYTKFAAKVQTVKELKEANATEAKRLADTFRTAYATKTIKYSETTTANIKAELDKLANGQNNYKAEIVKDSVKVVYQEQNNAMVYGQLKVQKDDCCVKYNFSFAVKYKCEEPQVAPKGTQCIDEKGNFCEAPEKGTCDKGVCPIN